MKLYQVWLYSTWGNSDCGRDSYDVLGIYTTKEKAICASADAILDLIDFLFKMEEIDAEGLEYYKTSALHDIVYELNNGKGIDVDFPGHVLWGEYNTIQIREIEVDQNFSLYHSKEALS